MRPLHLCASKDRVNRPALCYIQIKAGFVYASNGIVAIKLPVIEVFGVDDMLDICPVSDTEELYFDAALWRSAKMDKAVTIERDGLTFTGFDKELVRRDIVAFTKSELPGEFPDMSKFIYTEEYPLVDINRIDVNPLELYNLSLAFGAEDKYNRFKLHFRGNDKGVVVTNNLSTGIGMIMPILILN